MKPLRESWQSFVSITLNPWSMILILSTILLNVVLIRQTDRNIVSILTLLVSLSSGILGGVLAKKWDDLTGEKVLIARGKVAIRGLKLLLGSAVALQKRVRYYLALYTKASKKKRDISIP